MYPQLVPWAYYFLETNLHWSLTITHIFTIDLCSAPLVSILRMRNEAQQARKFYYLHIRDTMSIVKWSYVFIDSEIDIPIELTLVSLICHLRWIVD